MMSRNADAGAACELRRRRLEAQRLSSTACASPAEAVAWFGAVQAQDYLGALWAVGLRTQHAEESDVERALAEREIVRSWPMRGTLHFLAAADARWMIELLAPRVARSAATRLRSLAIDETVLSSARRALVARLEGGRCLARPDAYRALERAGVETSTGRGLAILWKLAHEGLLCMGPRRDRQHSFVLLEEWVPPGNVLRGDEALGELARRYYQGHGPATTRDLAWWSGLGLTGARRAVDVAGTLLREETIGGQPFWSLRAAPRAAPRLGLASARALPPFDEFFVGYADRSAPVDAMQARRPTPLELLGPVIVHDGRLVATWKRRFAPRKVVCAVTPRTKLSGRLRMSVRRALARYAAFLQLELVIEGAPT
jgi:hypothetical protein